MLWKLHKYILGHIDGKWENSHKNENSYHGFINDSTVITHQVFSRILQINLSGLITLDLTLTLCSLFSVLKVRNNFHMRKCSLVYVITSLNVTISQEVLSRARPGLHGGPDYRRLPRRSGFAPPLPHHTWGHEYRSGLHRNPGNTRNRKA